MIYSRNKFSRLNRNEYVPEIILTIGIFLMIYLSNEYYEYSGNQYILTDDDDFNQFCPLYPSTMQGNIEFTHK